MCDDASVVSVDVGCDDASVVSVDVGCDLPDGRDASEEPTDGGAQLSLEVMQDDVTHQVVVARRVRPELEQNVSHTLSGSLCSGSFCH